MSPYDGLDRRLGARLPIAELWVVWRTDRPDRRSWRQRRHPMERQFGRVLDLSVSGAGIVAPHEPDLRIGSLIRIEIDGFGGMVGIQRIDATAEEGMWFYGVSFIDFPPKFTARIYARLDEMAAQGLEEQWRRAV